MDLTGSFASSENVVSREVNGEIVLLDLESGTYFGLNDVGGRVWELFNSEPRSLEAVCNIIQAEYEVAPDVAAQDIRDLTEDLLKRELIVPVAV